MHIKMEVLVEAADADHAQVEVEDWLERHRGDIGFDYFDLKEQVHEPPDGGKPLPGVLPWKQHKKVCAAEVRDALAAQVEEFRENRQELRRCLKQHGLTLGKLLHDCPPASEGAEEAGWVLRNMAALIGNLPGMGTRFFDITRGKGWLSEAELRALDAAKPSQRGWRWFLVRADVHV